MTSEVEPHAASDARIVEIETTSIRVPLGREYRGSTYHMTHRSTVFTRIQTAGGIEGFAYVGDEDAALDEIEDIILDEIAPVLLGADASRTEQCWEKAFFVTQDILRDRRLGLVALAAVDVAVWDALGKRVGMPLWKLWGGARDSVQAISIGGYYGSPVSLEEEVEAIRSRGLAGMKLKVGGLSPREDAERFRRVRRAAGDDFLIAADANQAWSPGQAIDFAVRIRDHDPLWFEEPCKWVHALNTLRDVRNRSGIAVCAGQSEFSTADCIDLMSRGAIDYCNFDSSWSGGPTEWRRTAAAATSFGVQMAHHEEAHVSAHLLASIPHGTFAEFFEPERDPIWPAILASGLKLHDGVLELPQEPGLGWELDQDFIRRYEVPRDRSRVVRLADADVP